MNIRSRSNSVHGNTQSTKNNMKKQRSMNVISQELSKLPDNQTTEDKVRWMLGAPVNNHESYGPSQAMANNAFNNNEDKEFNDRRISSKNSDSSIDSANAAQTKMLSNTKK